MSGFAFLTLQPVSFLISGRLGKLSERPVVGGAPGSCSSTQHMEGAGQHVRAAVLSSLNGKE